MQIKLYAKDFENLMDWFLICKAVNADITSTVLILDINKVKGIQE